MLPRREDADRKWERRYCCRIENKQYNGFHNISGCLLAGGSPHQSGESQCLHDM